MSMLDNGKMKKQRGLAAVECTIVMPLLLSLLLATAEFGRYMYTYNSLTKSMEGGLRYLTQYAIAGIGQTVQPAAARMAEARNIVVYGNVSGTGNSQIPDLDVTNVIVTTADTSFLEINIVNFTYTPMITRRLADSGLDLSIPMNAGVKMRAIN
jgi:Flp pilus assembly protein TadG